MPGPNVGSGLEVMALCGLEGGRGGKPKALVLALLLLAAGEVAGIGIGSLWAGICTATSEVYCSLARNHTALHIVATGICSKQKSLQNTGHRCRR